MVIYMSSYCLPHVYIQFIHQTGQHHKNNIIKNKTTAAAAGNKI